MNKLDAYLAEHREQKLTLQKEGTSLWKATVSHGIRENRVRIVAIGRGATPSAALTDLDRKLAMFAH